MKNSVKYQKYFKTLQEAVKYRDELLSSLQ